MGKNPMNAMFVTLGFRNQTALKDTKGHTLETNLIDVMHARKDF